MTTRASVRYVKSPPARVPARALTWFACAQVYAFQSVASFAVYTAFAYVAGEWLWVVVVLCARARARSFVARGATVLTPCFS